MANGWLEKIARAIPAAFYRVLFKRQVLFFFYHVISDESLPHTKHLYAYKSPAMFEHDLIYLQHNHRLIPYDQLVAHHHHQTRLEPNSVLLSFDDGYSECFSLVRPLLLKYGVPCTFFITTDLIDNKNMLYRQKTSLCIEKVTTSAASWKQAAFKRLKSSLGRAIDNDQDFVGWIKSYQFADQATIDLICEMLEIDIAGYLSTHKPYMSLEQVRTLASDGFTIGAHSISHPLLQLLDAEAIEQEIVESCQIIRDITKKESIPFAFPFHGTGLQRDLLEDICSRNKVVGLLFGTRGIKEHKGLIRDRIWADAPEWDGSGQSNLPGLLHLTYQDIVLDKMRDFNLYQ